MSWSWAPVVLMIAIGLIGMAVVTLRDPRIRGAGAPLIVALSTGLSVCTFPLLLVPAFLEDEASDWLWLPYLLMIAATTIVILYGLAHFYQRKRFSDVQLSSAAFWLLTSLGVIVIVAASFAQIPASQWVPSLAVPGGLDVRRRVHRREMAPTPDTQESTSYGPTSLSSACSSRRCDRRR